MKAMAPEIRARHGSPRQHEGAQSLVKSWNALLTVIESRGDALEWRARAFSGEPMNTLAIDIGGSAGTGEHGSADVRSRF
jgi:hypothetical protein